MNALNLIGNLFHHFGENGGKILRVNWRSLLLLAGLLTVMWVLLSQRDRVLPLSYENPLFPYLDILVISAFDFVRFMILGMLVANSVSLIAKGYEPATDKRAFMSRWMVISLVFALAMLTINAVQLHLEFSGETPLGPNSTIIVRLGSIYLQLLVFWVAVYFYVSTTLSLLQRDETRALAKEALITRRFALLAAATLVYLVPSGLISTVILYSPIVAPFWFGLDQLAGTWNAMMQMVSVAADTVSALIYAVFIAVAACWITEKNDAGSKEPASS